MIWRAAISKSGAYPCNCDLATAEAALIPFCILPSFLRMAVAWTPLFSWSVRISLSRTLVPAGVPRGTAFSCGWSLNQSQQGPQFIMGHPSSVILSKLKGLPLNQFEMVWAFGGALPGGSPPLEEDPAECKIQCQGHIPIIIRTSDQIAIIYKAILVTTYHDQCLWLDLHHLHQLQAGSQRALLHLHIPTTATPDISLHSNWLIATFNVMFF
jgi:hypothetical protein